MAHDDVCPCKHGIHVCLIPCSQCSPDGPFLLDDVDLDTQIRDAYHDLAVENERSRAVQQTEQKPQTQMALNDQLESLRVLANRWGYYDAADFIARHLNTESGS